MARAKKPARSTTSAPAKGIDRGEVAAMMLKAGETSASVPRIYRAEEVVPRMILPSGHETLDAAYGIGGIPCGRVITYHGPAGCGKTTLALQDAVNVQRRGGLVYYFDFENKLDVPYARSLGVNPEFFIIDPAPHIEAAMRKVEQTIGVVRKKAPDMPILYVWDSVTSAKCKDTYESDWEDYNFAREARYYGDKLPKFCRLVSETNAIVVGIAQKRMKKGGGRNGQFVDSIGPGNAWEHHVTCVLSWKTKSREKGNVSGYDGEEVQIELAKNQVGIPYKRAKLFMRYGEGYNPMWSLLEHGVTRGIIEQSGSYYSFGGSVIAQGKKNVVAELEENTKLASAIRKVLRADYNAREVGPIAPGGGEA